MNEREQLELDLRSAQGDLEVAFRAVEQACRDHLHAYGEYETEHGGAPPFPFDKNDLKMVTIIKSFSDMRKAEQARDDIKVRISRIENALSRLASS